jgi:hypothetical protein
LAIIPAFRWRPTNPRCLRAFQVLTNRPVPDRLPADGLPLPQSRLAAESEYFFEPSMGNPCMGYVGHLHFPVKPYCLPSVVRPAPYPRGRGPSCYGPVQSPVEILPKSFRIVFRPVPETDRIKIGIPARIDPGTVPALISESRPSCRGIRNLQTVPSAFPLFLMSRSENQFLRPLAPKRGISMAPGRAMPMRLSGNCQCEWTG